MFPFKTLSKVTHLQEQHDIFNKMYVQNTIRTKKGVGEHRAD